MKTSLKTVKREILSLDDLGLDLELTHKPNDGFDSPRVIEANGRIIVGYLVHDDDCSSPLEDDGVGAIYSLSSRHINHKDGDEIRAILESDKDAVPLSYYEHGLSLWDVMGGDHISGCPDMQWDGVPFAGVWVPDDCVRESYMGQDGKTRRQWIRDQAKSACEQYTDWINGDCWGVCVDVFDSKGVKLSDDAYWGHVGSKWALEALNEAMENEAENEADNKPTN